MPQPDIAVLGGLTLTSTDFRDFRAHGPRMRIDDFFSPTGRFDARVSAFVGIGDDRLGRAPLWHAADATFTQVFAVPSSRCTVAAPTFLYRNRRFQNQLPTVSPEIRCPPTPRRRRSLDLCTQDNMWILFFNSILPCVEQPCNVR